MQPKNEGIDFRSLITTRWQETIVAPHTLREVVLFPNRDPALGLFLVSGDLGDVLSILSGGQHDVTADRRNRSPQEPEK
jgi:hypothetical protein